MICFTGINWSVVGSCEYFIVTYPFIYFQLAKLMAELNKVPGLFPGRRMAMSASTTVL